VCFFLRLVLGVERKGKGGSIYGVNNKTRQLGGMDWKEWNGKERQRGNGNKGGNR
jgi:hypothetical protein